MTAIIIALAIDNVKMKELIKYQHRSNKQTPQQNQNQNGVVLESKSQKFKQEIDNKFNNRIIGPGTYDIERGVIKTNKNIHNSDIKNKYREKNGFDDV